METFLTFDEFNQNNSYSTESLKKYLLAIGSFGEKHGIYEPYACELSLTDLAHKHPGLEAFASEIIIDRKSALSVRINAVYYVGLVKKFRGIPELLSSFLNSIEETTERPLSLHPAFLHLRAYSLTAIGGPEMLRRAIECAGLAAERLPENPGTLHQFAYTIVVACEDDVIKDIEERNRLLDRAADSVDRALNINLYPTYLATRGRLRALFQRFDDAKYDLRRAISVARQQGSGSEDDSVLHLNVVIAKQGIFAAELRAQALYSAVERDIQRIRDSNTRSIELMAMFSAIISLIYLTVNESQKMSLHDASTLFESLLGVILSLEASVMFLLYAREYSMNIIRVLIHLFVLLLGLILLFRPWEWLTSGVPNSISN